MYPGLPHVRCAKVVVIVDAENVQGVGKLPSGLLFDYAALNVSCGHVLFCYGPHISVSHADSSACCFGSFANSFRSLYTFSYQLTTFRAI